MLSTGYTLCPIGLLEANVMKKSFRIALIALCAAIAMNAAPIAAADDDAVTGRVTFTKDILPILQENCQTCHRPSTAGFGSMVAPMALIEYTQVRPWAKAMADKVQSREMPPWSASKEQRGLFENERYLTDEEIAKIVRWSQTGALRGSPEDAPAPLVFNDKEWWLGVPDLIVPLPERVWVSDDKADWQPSFSVELTEEMLPEDRWLRAMESKPGSSVVHHIVVYADMERDRGPVGVGGNLGGLAPGAEPEFSKEGYGILLKKGTTLRISMHYHKEPGPGTGAWDQSRIGLHFYPKDTKAQNIQISPIGNMGFEIPPGSANWEVGMARTFERPVTLMSMLPHMHFRGTAAKYTAYYPDGTEEMLLDVPRYDYAWQHSYSFTEPKHLPVGTRIEVSMWFDNSTENPANPDPEKSVRFGGPTTDEMALGWMYYSFNDEEPAVASASGSF